MFIFRRYIQYVWNCLDTLNDSIQGIHRFHRYKNPVIHVVTIGCEKTWVSEQDNGYPRRVCVVTHERQLLLWITGTDLWVTGSRRWHRCWTQHTSYCIDWLLEQLQLQTMDEWVLTGRVDREVGSSSHLPRGINRYLWKPESQTMKTLYSCPFLCRLVLSPNSTPSAVASLRALLCRIHPPTRPATTRRPFCNLHIMEIDLTTKLRNTLSEVTLS